MLLVKWPVILKWMETHRRTTIILIVENRIKQNFIESHTVWYILKTPIFQYAYSIQVNFRVVRGFGVLI